MISLVALFPNHLNLNGDLANIKVLQQRLAWRNVDCVVTFVDKGENVPAGADFILLGHGSEAAWADLQDDLHRITPELTKAFENGLPGLAVASGYERLFKLEDGVSLALDSRVVKRIERSSKFVIAELGENRALGYVNSDAELEPLIRLQNLFGTLLHGPVLAKNVWLAESIIRAIFDRRGETVPEILAKDKADQVAGFISKIWELEEPLARE